MTTFEVKRLKALYQLRLDIVEKHCKNNGAVREYALNKQSVPCYNIDSERETL